MMIHPPIDKLVSKVGCKYVLVIATAKRAKFLLDKKPDMLIDENTTAITYASKEIYNDKLEIKKED